MLKTLTVTQSDSLRMNVMLKWCPYNAFVAYNGTKEGVIRDFLSRVVNNAFPCNGTCCGMATHYNKYYVISYQVYQNLIRLITVILLLVILSRLTLFHVFTIQFLGSLVYKIQCNRKANGRPPKSFC